MATRGGNQPIENFGDKIGYPDGFLERQSWGSGSDSLAEAITWLKTGRPRGQNHWSTLCLALIGQAEGVLAIEGVDSLDDIFTTHPPEMASPGGRAVHTLNFVMNDGKKVTLRGRYNKILEVIRNDMLREHPKNEGHATSTWPQYRDFIELVFRMGPEDRAELARYIWATEVLTRPEITLAEVRERVERPFERLLKNMETAVKGVPGGSLLQGIAYGYLRADSPNLILETDKVNTGSSRAGRLGDVDGFRGSEPELVAEVKDMVLDESNAETQLTDFLEDVASAPNATAVVVCRKVTDAAREVIESRNIVVLTVEDLAWAVRVWDVPKQQEALLGIDYYLGRIQRSTKAQKYFRGWLADNELDAGLGFPGSDDGVA